MRAKAPWMAAVFVAAAVLGAAGTYVALALGLVLDERYLAVVGRPLGMAAAGLLSALAAKWTGDLLAPGRTRARLFPLAGLGAAGGFVLGALASLVVPLVAQGGGTMGLLLLPTALALGAWTTALAARLRDPKRPLRRDALASLALVLLGVPAIVYGTVGLGCALDLCGA